MGVVVRLRSIELPEARGLLVPGQGSTLVLWGCFAEMVEESLAECVLRRKEDRSGRGLNGLHLGKSTPCYQCRGIFPRSQDYIPIMFAGVCYV